jgi:hypothetical protein
VRFERADRDRRPKGDSDEVPAHRKTPIVRFDRCRMDGIEAVPHLPLRST